MAMHGTLILGPLLIDVAGWLYLGHYTGAHSGVSHGSFYHWVYRKISSR